MEPSVIKSTIDEAAKHDDRWLFVALLVIGLLVCWALARYFMREIAKLQVAIDECRNEFEGYLQTQGREVTSALNAATSAITQNTRVIETLRIP